MVHMDGFTQEFDLSYKEDANLVWRLPHESLPVHTRTRLKGSTSSNATEVQKHYHYVATLPAYGTVCCVAMKSGCRNLPEHMPDNFHFWFDLLVAEGLATEEQQKELQEREWRVCHPHALYTFFLIQNL